MIRLRTAEMIVQYSTDTTSVRVLEASPLRSMSDLLGTEDEV